MDWWLATLGRNHFPPCYMYTCSGFIAYALIGRLRRGAINALRWISPHAGLEPASPIIQSRKQSQSWKSWLYCCWFENKYSLSFTGLPEFLVDSALCTGWPVFIFACALIVLITLLYPSESTHRFISHYYYHFCIKLLFSYYVYLVRSYVALYVKKWIDSRVWEWKLWPCGQRINRRSDRNNILYLNSFMLFWNIYAERNKRRHKRKLTGGYITTLNNYQELIQLNLTFHLNTTSPSQKLWQRRWLACMRSSLEKGESAVVQQIWQWKRKYKLVGPL